MLTHIEESCTGETPVVPSGNTEGIRELKKKKRKKKSHRNLEINRHPEIQNNIFELKQLKKFLALRITDH